MIDNKEVFGNDSSALESIAQDAVEESTEDFSSFTIDELIDFLEKFNLKDGVISKANALLAQVKNSFDQHVLIFKEESLQKYFQEGGEEADFEFKKDERILKIEHLYGKVKASIQEYFGELEKAKIKNSKLKNDLLTRLRTLINTEESALSLEEFKSIQEEWKKIGQVPIAQASELWNSYKALVDMFYNNRSIFFELKELDRKKNLEAKNELCEKVERLASLDSVTQALKDLKSLHEEFRHIGPVPKDDQESLWNRLKAASDKIYEKRKEFLAQQKVLQESNLVLKLSILEKLNDYLEFNSSRIDDWKVKTSEVQKIQEEWKNSGSISQDKAKELSAKFWEHCKRYYKRKNDFFKELDKRRDENLVLKIELCELVESFASAEQLEEVLKEVKEVQKKWEKIGQVPFKQKDKVATRFKEACDQLFNKKRGLLAEAEQVFYENLTKKEQLISTIKEYVKSDELKTLDKLKAFQEHWDSIGFVPRDKKKTIVDAFNISLSSFIDVSKEITQEAKASIRLTLEVLSLKSSPDGLDQLKKKELGIQRKISTIKTEVDRYKTNIEFFGKSKGAEKMKEEIQSNIDKLEKELTTLKEELKVFKS